MMKISFSLLLLAFPMAIMSQTRKRDDYQWDKYVQPLMDSVQKASGCKIYYRPFCTIRKSVFVKLDSVTKINYGLDSSQLACIYDSWKNNLLPVPEVWKKETFTGEMTDVMRQPQTSIYSVSLPIFIRPDVYMIQTWMMRRCNSAASVLYIVEYNENTHKIKVRYAERSQ